MTPTVLRSKFTGGPAAIVTALDSDPELCSSRLVEGLEKHYLGNKRKKKEDALEQTFRWVCPKRNAST